MRPTSFKIQRWYWPLSDQLISKQKVWKLLKTSLCVKLFSSSATRFVMCLVYLLDIIIFYGEKGMIENCYNSLPLWYLIIIIK